VLGFAVCFGGSVLFNLLAIREGPLSLTALATNYSLLIPTFYGLLFLREQASWQLYAGLICLAASLFLVSRKNVKFTITVKWLIFALLTFLCNGFGSVMQTVQQNRFDGQYKNEFNILMLALLFILFLTISLIVERKQIAACVKVGAPFMALKGIGNGAVNLLILVVLSRGVPASIAFPLVSGGGIVLSTLLSIFVYREKLSVQQYIGLALGVVSVVLMKL
jgi:small multidrug resistance pump